MKTKPKEKIPVQLDDGTSINLPGGWQIKGEVSKTEQSAIEHEIKKREISLLVNRKSKYKTLSKLAQGGGEWPSDEVGFSESSKLVTPKSSANEERAGFWCDRIDNDL